MKAKKFQVSINNYSQFQNSSVKTYPMWLYCPLNIATHAPIKRLENHLTKLLEKGKIELVASMYEPDVIYAICFRFTSDNAYDKHMAGIKARKFKRCRNINNIVEFVEPSICSLTSIQEDK